MLFLVASLEAAASEAVEEATAHGEYLFNSLKKVFPHHFKRKSDEGNMVILDENSESGQFIIRRLSQRYNGLQVCWFNRDASDANGDSAVCYHSEEGLLEIKFSEKFKDRESSGTLFWLTLLYRLNMADLYEARVEIKKNDQYSFDKKLELIVRNEYDAKMESQRQYRFIESSFCENNNISYKDRKLFRYEDDFEGYYAWLKVLDDEEDNLERVRRWLKH
ncbi:hypothetical protein JIN82_12185 [Persicirhabdus sediminis]|uniref:Uncharacterized protein n=1 Tax=Persicirhabdus sediminis TaxID=454144 RepID=A0A8J7MEH3_9BACT|nr:hypothetical protein [Persicirhabdus sediminis]